MKSISTIVAWLLASLLVVARAAAWNEPEDFRGIEWGSPPAALTSSLCEPLQGGEPRPPQEKIKLNDPRVRYLSCVLDRPIGAVRVNVTWIFLDNKFSGVWIGFKPPDFSTIENGFRERYGEPVNVEETEIENRAGAKFTQRELLWTSERILIKLSRYRGKITDSGASIVTRELTARFNEQTKQRGKDAAKDL